MKKGTIILGVALLVSSNLTSMVVEATTILNRETLEQPANETTNTSATNQVDSAGIEDSSIAIESTDGKVNNKQNSLEKTDSMNESMDETTDTGAINQADSEEIEQSSTVVESTESQAAIEKDSTSLDKESKATIVESGTFGTSSWTLDDAGVVHFSAGEFIDSYPPVNTTNSPIFPDDVRSKVKEIVFDGPIVVKGSNYLFANLTSLSMVTNAHYLDMSSVDTMENMFAFDYELTSLDVSIWDVSSVTDMSGSFYDTGLITLDVSNWDVSSVTDMQQLFASCKSLQTVDVSKWDVSSVKTMSRLFSQFQGSELNNLDVSKWDVSSVIDMYELFKGNPKLTSLDVSNWDVSSVRDMSRMFTEDATLRNLDMSAWDVSSVTNMSEMFSGNSAETNFNISNWDTSAVKDMSEMFSEDKALTNLDISAWNVASVTDMSKMFFENKTETKFDISSWNLSSVTDMSGMFASCDNLNEINLAYTRTGSATMNTTDLLKSSTNVKHIKEIVIGPDTVLTDANIHLLVADDQYTGKWQDIGTGSVDGPTGTNVYTSEELNSGATIVPGTYVWQHKAPAKGADVTVNYVDEQGNSLATKEVLSGNVGESFTTTQKDISGYVFKKVEGATSGNFTDKEQSVTYIYSMDQTSIDAKDSTIYVGDTWNAVDNFVSATDKDGNPVVFENIQVVGSADTTKAGTYEVTYENGDMKKTIKVTVLEQDNVVTVHYQDEAGNTIAPDKLLSGNSGDSYNSEKLVIQGYTFKEAKGATSGVFTAMPQTVVYIYSKDYSGEIGSSSSKPVESSSVSVPETTSEQEKLPQTGETQNSLVLVIGIFTLLGGLVLSSKRFGKVTKK